MTPLHHPKPYPLLRYPRLTLAIALLTGLAAAYASIHLQFNYSFWTLFASDNPERQALERYVDAWGDDGAVVYLGLRSHQPPATVLTKERLATIETLEAAIAAIPGIEQVTSVLTVETISGQGDTLNIGPLAPDGPPSNAAAIDQLRSQVHGHPLLEGTYLSANERTTALVVRINPALRDASQRNPVVAAIDAAAKKHAPAVGLKPLLTGVPVAQWIYSDRMVQDLAVFTFLSILLLAGSLWVLYRQFWTMVLPLAAVGWATLMTTATMVVCGQPVNMITTAIPTLILVIGIADGVHLISHYRRIYATGASAAFAVTDTVRHLGRACLLTSVTTAVGFASLSAASIEIVRDFGVYAAIGIAYAFVANLALIPAGLLVLGRKATASQLTSTAATTANGATASKPTTPLTTLLTRLGLAAEHAPRSMLAASAGLVLAVSLGATGVKIESRVFEEVADDDPVVLAHRAMEQDLHGISAYALDLTAPPGTFHQPKVLTSLAAVAAVAKGENTVQTALSIVDVLTTLNRALEGGAPQAAKLPSSPAQVAQLLMLAEGPVTERLINTDGSRARIWLRGPEVITSDWADTRKRLQQAAAAQLPPQVQTVITGPSDLAHGSLTTIVRDVLTSLLGATVLILLVMSVLFRSFRVGLISMVPNLIPLFMVLGIMGYLGIYLRTSTVVIFSVSLGLAVDDTIHFLVRYRTLRRHHTCNHEAIRGTLRTAGAPIVHTSLLLAGGFGILVVSEFRAVRDVGFLGGITLLSALLADLVILPALLSLTGGHWFQPALKSAHEAVPATPEP